MQGRCKNNAGPTSTSTNLTMKTGKYISEILMNSAANQPIFNVYNFSTCTNYAQVQRGILSSCTLMWSNTVSANIPNAAGREFGYEHYAYQSTTSAAAILVYWDSREYWVDRRLTRGPIIQE